MGGYWANKQALYYKAIYGQRIIRLYNGPLQHAITVSCFYGPPGLEREIVKGLMMCILAGLVLAGYWASISCFIATMSHSSLLATHICL